MVFMSSNILRSDLCLSKYFQYLGRDFSPSPPLSRRNVFGEVAIAVKYPLRI